MTPNDIPHRKTKAASRVAEFMEKTFLQKKLNNWMGVMLTAFISVVLGYLLARQLLLGLGLFAMTLALAVVIITLLSLETGFYINLVYALTVYHFRRLFFNDSLPVGIVTDVLIVSMLLSLFIRRDSLRKNFNEFVHTPVVIWTILLYFYLTIELFNPYGHSFEAWLQTFRRSLESLVFLFVAYQMMSSRERIRQYLRVLFVVCTIVGLYGCVQQWHGLFEFERLWVISDETRMGLMFIEDDFRKFSTFNDPTAFGILMSSCSVLFIILSFGLREKRTKWIIRLGCFFMLLGMAYSGTRTANVMLVAGFGMFVLLSFNQLSTRIFALFALCIFLGVMYAPIYTNNVINRFRTSFIGSRDESFKVRELSRAIVQPYIRNHPIGGGLLTTGKFGVTYNPGHYLAGFQTDNGYLQIALETGWIGLGFILILFYCLIRDGIRGYFNSVDPETRALYAGATSAIFCFYVAEFAQNAIGQTGDMAFYYPIMAVILKLKNYDTLAPGTPAG
jgi:putative inorganic carbon (hco3(-)) transporter